MQISSFALAYHINRFIGLILTRKARNAWIAHTIVLMLKKSYTASSNLANKKFKWCESEDDKEVAKYSLLWRGKTEVV